MNGIFQLASSLVLYRFFEMAVGWDPGVGPVCPEYADNDERSCNNSPRISCLSAGRAEGRKSTFGHFSRNSPLVNRGGVHLQPLIYDL